MASHKTMEHLETLETMGNTWFIVTCLYLEILFYLQTGTLVRPAYSSNQNVVLSLKVGMDSFSEWQFWGTWWWKHKKSIKTWAIWYLVSYHTSSPTQVCALAADNKCLHSWVSFDQLHRSHASRKNCWATTVQSLEPTGFQYQRYPCYPIIFIHA